MRGGLWEVLTSFWRVPARPRVADPWASLALMYPCLTFFFHELGMICCGVGGAGCGRGFGGLGAEGGGWGDGWGDGV